MEDSNQTEKSVRSEESLLTKILRLPIRSIARTLAKVNAPIKLAQFVSALLMLISAYMVGTADISLVYAAGIFFLGYLINLVCEQLIILVYYNYVTYKLTTNVIRYLGFAAFFNACGILAFIDSGSSFYIFAVTFTILLWGYLTLLLSRYATVDNDQLTNLFDSGDINRVRNESSRYWERALFTIHSVVKIEYVPFIVLLFAALELPGIIYWSSSLLLVGAVIIILRLLSHQDSEESNRLRRSTISFLFYLVGATLLIYLILRLPLNDVVEAMNVVGPEVGLLILFPAVWVIPNSMTLRVLLDDRISFRDALYTQITGDGFNSITPFLGLGGEPYKAKHLSRFVSLQDSSRAIIQSRLIHALSGVMFTATILSVCLLIVDFSELPGLKAGLAVVVIIMIAIASLLLWVTTSKTPSRITGFVLTKFKLIDEFRHDHLSWSKLLVALGYRLAGRFGKFFEVYLIFFVLDIFPKFADAVLVEGMLMASISIFFFVPQGLGVNEAGIVTALTVAGYSAATGVVFGLIRRARMVIYAVIGLIVYMLGTMLNMGKTHV